MKSDAFGTQLRVDDKDWIALANCIVGAFRFACAAINAIVGYHRRHEKTP
jgi:intracellular septation protein A